MRFPSRFFALTPVATAFAAMLAAIFVAPSSVSAQITQDFDDPSLLPGQGGVATNNSSPVGTIGWFTGNSVVFDAYNGAASSYLAANFNSAAGVGTISNWYLTPLQTLTNGSVFSFFTRTVSEAFAADRLELRLSTAGSSTNVGASATSVGDFTTLLLSINPTLVPAEYPSEWTQYSATLSGLASPTTGRFAFRYFVENGGPEGENSDYIGIDAVRYTVNPVSVPEPSSVALLLTGVVGFGAVVRRRGTTRA